MRAYRIYDKEQALSVQVINGEYAHEIIESFADGHHALAWKAVIDGKPFGNYVLLNNAEPLRVADRDRIRAVIARNVEETYRIVLSGRGRD